MKTAQPPFAYSDGSETVTYTVDTTSDQILSGLMEVSVSRNGGAPVKAVSNAGTGYLTAAGKKLTPVQFAAAAQTQLDVTFDQAGGSLYLHYTQTYQGITTEKTYGICIKGKSLVIHVMSADQRGRSGYSWFECGSSEGLTSPRITNSIYAEEVSVTVVGDAFLSAYLDKAKTFGTKVTNAPSVSETGTVHGMTAYYELNSAGQTNPLNEVFYLTVSQDMLDCVYLNNAEKSQYRDTLNDLVVYDNWEESLYSERNADYTKLAQMYGLKDILLVDHRWQRDNLDVSNPAHYPASTTWGSAQEFMDYITAVKETLGWRLALHEDYWFIQPSSTNQYWDGSDTSKIAQNADGTLRYGWLTTSYANLSNMMAEYAAMESPKIEAAYDPGASFLDVNGGVDPSVLNQVTLNASSSTSRTLAQVVADTVTLFQQEKEIYSGPVISEGAQGDRSFGSAYAGWLDAGSREITDCSDCRIMPDYELVYIRPKMANQGMGPPARFQTDATLDTYGFDKYNAAALAYGHTGFIGEVHYASPLVQDELINAYYTFRAIQPQYLDSTVTVEEISYFTSGGSKLNLNQAVLQDYDFTAARLYIRYSSGLELYLNFSGENWNVTLNGHSYTLDQNGYAAENPSQSFVQYSCLIDGVRVDCVKSSLYTYYNPRGNLVDFGDGTVTSQMQIFSDDLDYGAREGQVVNFAEIASLDTNGANGLTFYRTADGKTYVPYSVRDTRQGRWIDQSDGHYNMIAPKQDLSTNYGLIMTSSTQYVAIGYQVPETGTIDLRIWFALQGDYGYDYQVQIARGNSILHTYDMVGASQLTREQTVTLSVTKGEEIFLIFKPIDVVDDAWAGYKAQITWKTVK